MATDLMPPPTQARRNRTDLTPREIIASARAAPAPALGALWLAFSTALLMLASFTPADCGPLGWICLVPLLLLVRLERPTRWMYQMVYLGGLFFWVAALQWLRLGDPTMYIAWAAASVYFALYFPAFVALSRIAVQRLKVPMPLAVPVVWTGLEYLRANLMTGFTWYALGHSQYRWTELIQISDLTGSYGVSFVMAAVAASIAEWVSNTWLRRLRVLGPWTRYDIPLEPIGTRRRTLGAVCCLALFGCVLAYGYVRRGQADFEAGPRVAAIQGNFPTSVRNDHDPAEMWRRHETLTGQAVLKQPDLIVWPESMFCWPLAVAPPDMSDEELEAAVPDVPVERWHDTMVRQALNTLSQKAGAALVVGLQTVTASRQGRELFNSAAFITPERGVGVRYDKLHRVPFGEYLPLSGTLPFLGSLTPYRGDYGISAGAGPVTFEYRGVRYAPIICFEDTVPDVVRGAVRPRQSSSAAGRGADVILNLTNDGWFHGSSELDQHLITAAFRCVECRTPMVRAVNTGISALIDGDGVIRARAQGPDGKTKQVEAILVETVPLDRRASVYVTYGDWFAGSCLFGCAAILAGGAMSLLSRRRVAAVAT